MLSLCARKGFFGAVTPAGAARGKRRPGFLVPRGTVDDQGMSWTTALWPLARAKRDGCTTSDARCPHLPCPKTFPRTLRRASSSGPTTSESMSDRRSSEGVQPDQPSAPLSTCADGRPLVGQFPRSLEPLAAFHRAFTACGASSVEFTPTSRTIPRKYHIHVRLRKLMPDPRLHSQKSHTSYHIPPLLLRLRDTSFCTSMYNVNERRTDFRTGS